MIRTFFYISTMPSSYLSKQIVVPQYYLTRMIGLLRTVNSMRKKALGKQTATGTGGSKTEKLKLIGIPRDVYS